MHKAQMSKTIFRREYYSKPVRIYHVYSVQTENKQDIFFRKLGKLDDPSKKYGKPLYRGKITLYGKKIQKYRKRQQIINENIGKYIPSFMFKTKKNI